MDLEFLDLLFGVLRLVLAHELGAVGRRGECACDLLVERFQSRLGGCVQNDELMAVGGRNGEENGERHCCDGDLIDW